MLGILYPIGAIALVWGLAYIISRLTHKQDEKPTK
jgi:flagellar biogenesis protein FliO